MTCSKVMKNSDTGGFRVGQTGRGHESGENADRRNSNGSNTSYIAPLSPPLKPKLGQSNNKGKAVSDPEKEKVYGYIDLFKNMGDTLPLRMFPLTLTSVTIGRDASCQIRIHNNARVSRHQCSIIVFPGQDKKSEDVKITLQNLTSRPTTVHKNRGLGLGEIVHLSHGDRFRLYDVELRFRIYDPVNEKGQLDWSRPIPVIRLNPPQDSNRPPPVLAPAPIYIPPVQTTTNTKTTPISIVAKNNNNVNRPVVKITKASPVSTNSWMNMNKSIIEQRRKSSPLPMSSKAQQQAISNSNPSSKMDLLKIPRWSSTRLNVNSNNNNNNNQNNKTLEKNQRNNNNEENSNNLNVMNSYDKRRASTGNYQPSLNYNSKRRGSADIDMRKAVLQRSFRRAFKERTLMLSQGPNIMEGGGQGQPEIIHSSRYRRALEDLIVLSSAA